MATRKSIYNRTAEAAVLGAVLLDHRCYDVEAVSALQPDDFFVPAHSAVWGAMLGLLKEGTRPDIVVLEQTLRATDELTLVGGLEGLGSLADRYAPTHNVAEHAGIVASLAKLRAAQQAMAEMVEEAYEVDHRDVSEYLAACSTRVADMQGRSPHGLCTFRDTVLAAGKQARARAEGTFVPLSFGLAGVDALCNGGMLPGELVIVAGRPGSGKTNIVQGVAIHAGRAGKAPLVFQLEMSKVELGVRAVASRGVISNACAEAPTKASHWEEFFAAEKDFASVVGEIVTGGITIPRAVAIARAWHRRQVANGEKEEERGPIVLDYLQRAATTREEMRMTRDERVGRWATLLKSLAQELGRTVIIGCQLNREVDKREDKRPRLSDLRESGALEQEANRIALLYRPWMYDRGENAQHAEVILGKNRGGTVGTVKCSFEGHFCRFLDAEQEQERSAPGFTYQDGPR